MTIYIYNTYILCRLYQSFGRQLLPVTTPLPKLPGLVSVWPTPFFLGGARGFILTENHWPKPNPSRIHNNSPLTDFLGRMSWRLMLMMLYYGNHWNICSTKITSQTKTRKSSNLKIPKFWQVLLLV